MGRKLSRWRNAPCLSLTTGNRARSRRLRQPSPRSLDFPMLSPQLNTRPIWRNPREILPWLLLFVAKSNCIGRSCQSGIADTVPLVRPKEIDAEKSFHAPDHFDPGLVPTACRRGDVSRL